MKFESFGFAVAYRANVLSGLPGYGNVVQFHAPGQTGHREGFVLHVIPVDGEAWVGNFAEGDYGIDGAFATPTPDRVCVVARGEVYLVRVNAADAFDIVAHDVDLVCRGDTLLLFITLTDIMAHDGMSVQWITSRLSYDGIKEVLVTDKSVNGMAWSAPKREWVAFEVDLHTGVHKGGAYE